MAGPPVLEQHFGRSRLSHFEAQRGRHRPGCPDVGDGSWYLVAEAGPTLFPYNQDHMSRINQQSLRMLFVSHRTVVNFEAQAVNKPFDRAQRKILPGIIAVRSMTTTIQAPPVSRPGSGVPVNARRPVAGVQGRPAERVFGRAKIEELTQKSRPRPWPA